MRILSIQHARNTPLGTLGEVIAARRGAAEMRFPVEGEALPPTHDGYDGLVLLGGPMSAADDAGYPHYRPLLALTQGFHAAGKPVLGLCLGAQLLARAFGKRVYRHSEREIGFVSLSPTEAAQGDALLENAVPPPPIMEWHEDTFELPGEAELLLTSETCEYQAYRVGAASYGFQCHWETDAAIIRSWVTRKRDWLAAHYPHVLASIEGQIARHIEAQLDFARKLSMRWLDLVEARKAEEKAAAVGA